MPIQLGPNVTIAERFRLNRQLGRGGMGSVWHATHLGLDTPCAVKFIEGESASLPEAQARFEREAKAAAQLRSPHVVQIFDHGVWQGTPYIAMELLDGEDLGKRLIRYGRLPPPEIVKIVAQVCRALTKAHAVGIVHRDLKPDNIFLVRDDDREIAKVLDFGIARFTNNAIEGSATKTGAMLGTPYYMSPEQAQGIKSVDFRSDLWSLAVIVFQAVTGKLPFESEALGDLLVKIIVSPVPVPSEFAAGVPPGFDAWWARASQRDPAGRFQSAKEFADSLSMSFGTSQGTDMMERRPFDSVAPPGMGQRVSTPPPAYGHTPPGGGPPGGGTVALSALPSGARPGANTPQPAMSGTPRPFQQTPGVPGAQAPTTGSPMTRSYGGGPGGAPAARKGMGLAIGGGAAALLVLGGLVLVFVMRGRGESVAAPNTAAAATPVVTGAAMTSTATAPPTASLEPPPPATATATAPTASSASSTEQASGTPTSEPQTGPNKGKPWPGAGLPPAGGQGVKPPPAGTGKKKPIDLGI